MGKMKINIELLRCLNDFKLSKDWSDLIANLNILNSSLKKSPNISNTVHLLNKRLNQCLNPSLPAGVHRKALESVNLVLHNKNTPQYYIRAATVGVFTYSCFSKLNVKKELLDLLKFVSKSNLIEVRTLIMSIFGVLESGSEFFYNALELLEIVRERDEFVFFEGIWSVFAERSDLRHSCLVFIKE